MRSRLSAMGHSNLGSGVLTNEALSQLLALARTPEDLQILFRFSSYEGQVAIVAQGFERKIFTSAAEVVPLTAFLYGDMNSTKLFTSLAADAHHFRRISRDEYRQQHNDLVVKTQAYNWLGDVYADRFAALGATGEDLAEFKN